MAPSKTTLEATKPVIAVSLSPEAVSVLLEGLTHIPLGRAMDLFTSLKAEAQRQIDSHSAQVKPNRGRSKAASEGSQE